MTRFSWVWPITYRASMMGTDLDEIECGTKHTITYCLGWRESLCLVAVRNAPSPARVTSRFCEAS